MSRIQRTFAPKRGGKSKPDAVNMEQFPAFGKTDKSSYLQMLMTNVLGNTFYASAKDQVSEAIGLHQLAQKAFPEFIGPAAAYARNFGFMRSQPVLAMASLAALGDTWHIQLAKYFPQVINTPNDLIDFMVALPQFGVKGQGGRRIKRLIGVWLAHRLNPYWVIKYGSEGHEGYSLKDILRTVHPAGVDEQLAEYVMRGNVGMYKQLAAFEALKKAENAGDAIEAVKAGRLPHEVVTPFTGKFPELWRALIPNLPIFALLRNLKTLERHDVLIHARPRIEAVFNDMESIQKSKIFPFQFYKAYEECKDSPGWLRDALSKAVDHSILNVPELPGKTLFALDISSSMEGDFLTTGSILGAAMAFKSTRNDFILFDTQVAQVGRGAITSVVEFAETIAGMAHGGTETELVGEYAHRAFARDRVGFDNVVIFTDEQQNAGRPFYHQIEHYRGNFNPKLKLFVVDVGSYAKSGGLAPQEGLNWNIYGWSPRVLDFMALAGGGFAPSAIAAQVGGLLDGGFTDQGKDEVE